MAVKRTQKAGKIASREHEVMAMLQGSENIVQLVDYFLTVDKRQRIIQNLVMEFCESSLEDVLREAEKTKQPIPMDKIKNFSKQVLNGLA